MPIRVEAYTAGGIATGVVAWSGQIREALDGAGDLVIEEARWLPLDGSPERGGAVRLPVDDLLLVVADEADGGPVHAQWHTIDLEAGPYRVVGEMPTMPGFDPGRALARPTGEFVFLRDARISLIEQEDAGEASAPATARQSLHGRSGLRGHDARVLLPGRRDGDDRHECRHGRNECLCHADRHGSSTGPCRPHRDPRPYGHGPGTRGGPGTNRCPRLGSRAPPERFGLSHPRPAAGNAALLGSTRSASASSSSDFARRRKLVPVERFRRNRIPKSSDLVGKERLRAPYEIDGSAARVPASPRRSLVTRSGRLAIQGSGACYKGHHPGRLARQGTGRCMRSGSRVEPPRTTAIVGIPRLTALNETSSARLGREVSRPGALAPRGLR